MPRLDHRVDTLAALSAREQLLLTVLISELNTVRTHAGLAPLTPQHVRLALKEALRQLPAQQEGTT